MIKRNLYPAVAPRYKRGNNKLVPLTRCHLLSALKCQVMSLWWNIFSLDVCLTKQVQCLALFYFNKRKQLLIWKAVTRKKIRSFETLIWLFLHNPLLALYFNNPVGPNSFFNLSFEKCNYPSALLAKGREKRGF